MKIGIIGGSGLDKPEILQNYQEKFVDTPYGNPSSSIICGKIGEIEVYMIARHGRNHEITPTEVNYRANIHALKQQGCTHILATSAVGSLREKIERGDFVILDQFIDFTRHRKITFYDDFKESVNHISLAEPFSDYLRKKLIDACRTLKIKHHEKGVVVTIEGPRFSTRAESNMFRLWGADVINMSIAPEATLAKEAEIEYAAIAMSTDYDCWKLDEKPVEWQEISRIFKENASKIIQLLLETIELIEKENSREESVNFIKNSIASIPDWPKKGIIFRDITTLLQNPKAFEKSIKILEQRYKEKEIDVIAGIESRGFIIGSALAQKLGKPLVLIRKPGKLPRETIKETYDLEYGTDSIEIHKDAVMPNEKVLLVDDLLATGGTAVAACNLIRKLHGDVIEACFIIELPDLNGRDKLPVESFSIVSFEGE